MIAKGRNLSILFISIVAVLFLAPDFGLPHVVGASATTLCPSIPNYPNDFPTKMYPASEAAPLSKQDLAIWSTAQVELQQRSPPIQNRVLHGMEWAASQSHLRNRSRSYIVRTDTRVRRLVMFHRDKLRLQFRYQPVHYFAFEFLFHRNGWLLRADRDGAGPLIEPILCGLCQCKTRGVYVF